jgi:hypothetical protein
MLKYHPALILAFFFNRPGIFSKKPDKQKKGHMKKTGRKNNVSLRNYIIVRDMIREIMKSLPRRKG